MKRTIIFPLLIGLSLILLPFLNARGFEGGPDEQKVVLIGVLGGNRVLYQYERIDVEVILASGLEKEDVVLITNIDTWIKGVPPITEQTPFSDLRNGADIGTVWEDHFTLWFNASDQLLWFDGKAMVQNVTITLAFLCIYNGTEDLETVELNLIDMNDPPKVVGPIVPVPIRPRSGDEVTFDIQSVGDPDQDPIEFEWNLGDGRKSSDRVTVHAYDRPGTYPVSLKVSDGYLTDSIFTTIMVLPKEVNIAPSNGSAGNNGTITQDKDKEQAPPWFIIPILMILIFLFLSLGLVQRAMTKRKENEIEPPRKLWSMSPLRGPSRYEKEVLKGRLNALWASAEGIVPDDEMVLEEDLERWGLDWSTDPMF